MGYEVWSKVPTQNAGVICRNGSPTDLDDPRNGEPVGDALDHSAPRLDGEGSRTLRSTRPYSHHRDWAGGAKSRIITAATRYMMIAKELVEAAHW